VFSCCSMGCKTQASATDRRSSRKDHKKGCPEGSNNTSKRSIPSHPSSEIMTCIVSDSKHSPNGVKLRKPRRADRSRRKLLPLRRRSQHGKQLDHVGETSSPTVSPSQLRTSLHPRKRAHSLYCPCTRGTPMEMTSIIWRPPDYFVYPGLVDDQGTCGRHGRTDSHVTAS